MIPRTTWVANNRPYTGKVPIKEVPVPKRPLQRKGHTKYDEDFEKLATFASALEVHEDNFETLRRALKRFVDFRELTGQVAIRQQINPQTRMVTLWLERKDEKAQ